MEKLLLLLTVFLVYHVTVCKALGPKCYKCDHVADPKDCDHYEQCSVGESCYVQRYMGQQLNDFYRMGCMPNNVCSQSAFSLFGSFVGKRQTRSTAHAHAIETRSHSKREEDLLLCLQCCTGDYCNLHGELCGTVASPNLRCFECDDVEDPTHCETITECPPNYKCLLHVYYKNNAEAPRYDMGCQKDFVCTVLKDTIDSSDDHVSCAECCDDKQYCNFDLCSGVKAALHGNSTSSSSGGTSGTGGVNPGTISTVITQAPAFTAQIPGNHLDQPYNGSITLKCQTSLSATKKWYLNSSAVLPAGVRVDPGTNDLIIDSLNENTVGAYSCVAATSGNPPIIKTASSVVSIQPQAPVITSFIASPHHPRLHSQVDVTCMASGWPTDIQFEWAFTSSGTTSPPPNVTYRNVTMGQVLHIGDFETGYHQGTFTCQAKNSAGTSQPSTLRLHARSQTQPVG